MRILVTGAAGFIGFHTAAALVARGDEVVGIDSINDYYDPQLKFARLARSGIGSEAQTYGRPVASTSAPAYRFVRLGLEDRPGLQKLFAAGRFDCVCNLAAQAGVRYSLENPYAYVESNLTGFVNLLECCRHGGVGHLVYASSSSVYGQSAEVPFSERDRADTPVSLYAATKRSNELMAYTYSHLYGLPATGLRFFTVYGPWGRPDMAPILFARAIRRGEAIKVFNNGELQRDFTYIDDIVEGVLRVIDRTPAGEPPCKLYNIGCSHPVQLMDFIRTLERALGRPARMEMLPMQAGDVYRTYADTSLLERETGYKPHTPLEEGIRRFVEWFDAYYGGALG